MGFVSRRGIAIPTILLAALAFGRACTDPETSVPAAARVVWTTDTIRTISELPSTMMLRGRSEDDLYLVVRQVPDFGTMFHYDGNRWVRPSIPDPTDRIYDVAPIGPGVAVAVGGSTAGRARVLMLSSGTWEHDDWTPDVPSLLAISGSKIDSLVAVGPGGTLYERHRASYAIFRGWGSTSLQRFGINVHTGPSAVPHAIQSFPQGTALMTFHDLLDGVYPVTRVLTWSGWWWHEENSVWGEHAPRVLMPEPGHHAWATSTGVHLTLHVLDHGAYATSYVSGTRAKDLAGTSLRDVLVLTERRLFRMNAEGHQAIPGPWDDRVDLATVWTNGPTVMVAGRSSTDPRRVVVFRGSRSFW